MNKLTKDCLCSIVYYLDFRQTYNFSRTCKKIMNEIYNNKHLWIFKIKNEPSQISIFQKLEYLSFVSETQNRSTLDLSFVSDIRLKKPGFVFWTQNLSLEIPIERLRKCYYYSRCSRSHALTKAVLNGDVDFVKELYFENDAASIRNHLIEASSTGHLNVVKLFSKHINPKEETLINMCLESGIRNRHPDIVKHFAEKCGNMKKSLLDVDNPTSAILLDYMGLDFFSRNILKIKYGTSSIFRSFLSTFDALLPFISLISSYYNI